MLGNPPPAPTPDQGSTVRHKVREPSMAYSCKNVTILLLSLGITLSSNAQDRPRNRIVQPIDGNRLVVLTGSVHPLAQDRFDMGRVAGSKQFNGVSLIFKPSATQQSALERLLREQQDRSSANYHKWLTPEQYADRFGLSR